ncbi:hypothetical protein BSKO_03926 [Bryopsis sp. KO-2023]|nr:hypothetical protein BSKO_03926 [Bryopsis sp. KO-2023]
MPSVFITAVELIPLVKDEEGNIQTEPFLNVARQVLPLIDQLGSAFYLVRHDISGNIERLAGRAHSDPNKYQRLFDIVKDEMEAGEHPKPLSCANGLLWLKRANDFILELLRCLQKDESLALYDAAYSAYMQSLQPFHGIMTRGVFSVALKVVPRREYFFGRLGTPEEVESGIGALLENWGPLMQDVHQFLEENELNDPAKV